MPRKSRILPSMLRMASICVIGSLFFAGTGPAAAEEVLVTQWGGPLEEARTKHFWEPFERATGIDVVLVSSNASKLLTSVEQGTPEADLTNLSGGTIAQWLARDALEKIDYDQFETATLDGIANELKHPNGVGAIIYSMVMAYNTQEYPDAKPRPQNWVEYWDVEKFPGPRGMVGCGDRLISGGALEFASLAGGATKDTLYPIDIDAAFAKLDELEPSIGKFWQQGAEAPQALISGELAMSTAFNGRIYSAQKDGGPVDLNWNDSLIQYDYWVVPKGSPNAENAMKLIAFITQAGPQAGFANETSFGPVNQNAYDDIPDDLAKWLPGSPDNMPKQIFQNFDWWNETGDDGKTNLEKAQEACVSVLAR